LGVARRGLLRRHGCWSGQAVLVRVGV
jgi:hypothetical protein